MSRGKDFKEIWLIDIYILLPNQAASESHTVIL